MHKKVKEMLMEILFESPHTLTYEEAQEWVHHMRPYGEKWSIEETTQLLSDKTIDKNEWYAVMNMMWNDYREVLGEGVDNYKKLSTAWFKDVDAPEGKTYKYYKESY